MWTILEKVKSNYQSWLERQHELGRKAIELIEKYKFRAVLIADDGNVPFIRLFIGDKNLDFYIKEIKSGFIRNIWLCKRKDFDPKNHYLIFSSKDEKWSIISGHQADLNGNYQDSSYHKGVKILVIPTDILRSATTFFKTIKKRYEEQLQKRMTDFA